MCRARALNRTMMAKTMIVSVANIAAPNSAPYNPACYPCKRIQRRRIGNKKNSRKEPASHYAAGPFAGKLARDSVARPREENGDAQKKKANRGVHSHLYVQHNSSERHGVVNVTTQSDHRDQRGAKTQCL
jgi:hypothetical protein